MASAVALACNGDLGAVPPVGSRGKAPGRGVRGLCPLKLKKISHLNNDSNKENYTFFSIILFCLCNQLECKLCTETLQIFKLSY